MADRAIRVRLSGMNQWMERLADDACSLPAENAGSRVVDERDRVRAIDTQNAVGRGVENEAIFPAQLYVYGRHCLCSFLCRLQLGRANLHQPRESLPLAAKRGDAPGVSAPEQRERCAGYEQSEPPRLIEARRLNDGGDRGRAPRCTVCRGHPVERMA